MPFEFRWRIEQARKQYCNVLKQACSWYNNTQQWSESSWVADKSVWDLVDDALDALIAAVRADPPSVIRQTEEKEKDLARFEPSERASESAQRDDDRGNKERRTLHALLDAIGHLVNMPAVTVWNEIAHEVSGYACAIRDEAIEARAEDRASFIAGYIAGRLDNDEETVAQQRSRLVDAEQEWELRVKRLADLGGS